MTNGRPIDLAMGGAPRAAAAAEHRQIIVRFYRLDPRPIARFYAARSTLFDTPRILTGKAPMPISRAIHALGATTS